MVEELNIEIISGHVHADSSEKVSADASARINYRNFGN